MVVDEVTQLVDGYYCILNKDGVIVDVLLYSPFTGEELPTAFWYELSSSITDYLVEDGNETQFEAWNEKISLNSPKFDITDIPEEKRNLINDRSWYKDLKKQERLAHNNGKFCGRFSVFIESCYSNYYHPLPKLACVPIQYCPFCGVKLPPEFDQENWWDKEFKTFKWDKDHKLGEWADDYVDDDDWTAEDYLRAYERIDAEREKEAK